MSSLFTHQKHGWNRTRLRFCINSAKNGAWGGEAGTDEKDVVCVRVADFAWDKLGLDLSNQTIRSVGSDQFRKLARRTGDILIEKSGGGEKTPVGRVVRFHADVDAITSNFVARLRPSRIVIPNYLTYLLAALYLSGFSHQFIKQSTGIQNLDDSALFASTIHIPDHQTQKSIADFLDREAVRIDQLIEKRERFRSLIEEKKASVVARMVDGSLLNAELGGPSGWFGNLPRGWKVRRAKFLLRERRDRSDAGEEELLTVSHITGVTKRSEKDVNMFLAESNEGYKLVSRGDVVINTMWAWMGAMGVSPEDGLISPSYGVYTPVTDDYDFAFLDLLLRSRPFVAEATRRSKGIHSSRLRLYPDAFLDTPLPVGPKDAQRPQSPTRLVQFLASEGILTPTEADDLRPLVEKRNNFIHGGLQTPITRAEINRIVSILDAMIDMAQTDPSRP